MTWKLDPNLNIRCIWQCQTKSDNDVMTTKLFSVYYWIRSSQRQNCISISYKLLSFSILLKLETKLRGVDWAFMTEKSFNNSRKSGTWAQIVIVLNTTCTPYSVHIPCWFHWGELFYVQFSLLLYNILYFAWKDKEEKG